MNFADGVFFVIRLCAQCYVCCVDCWQEGVTG